MAVAIENPVRTFLGNGVAVSFDFAPHFSLTEADHLVVLVDGVETQSGFVQNETGVVFSQAPAPGTKIVLQRRTPNDNPLELAGLRHFSLPSLSTAMDRFARLIQERVEAESRSLTFPPGTPADEIPDPADYVADIASKQADVSSKALQVRECKSIIDATKDATAALLEKASTSEGSSITFPATLSGAIQLNIGAAQLFLSSGFYHAQATPIGQEDIGEVLTSGDAFGRTITGEVAAQAFANVINGVSESLLSRVAPGSPTTRIFPGVSSQSFQNLTATVIDGRTVVLTGNGGIPLSSETFRLDGGTAVEFSDAVTTGTSSPAFQSALRQLEGALRVPIYASPDDIPVSTFGQVLENGSYSLYFQSPDVP